jgi:hypothetical protein
MRQSEQHARFVNETSIQGVCIGRVSVQAGSRDMRLASHVSGESQQDAAKRNYPHTLWSSLARRWTHISTIQRRPFVVRKLVVVCAVARMRFRAWKSS